MEKKKKAEQISTRNYANVREDWQNMTTREFGLTVYLQAGGVSYFSIHFAFIYMAPADNSSHLEEFYIVR